MDATKLSFHDTVKPIWSTDGTCIVTEAQSQGDEIEPALKRIHIFDPTDAALTDVRGII